MASKVWYYTSNSSVIFVQPFLQLRPLVPNSETVNLRGCWQVEQSTVSPLPIFLITLRCSLNELAADLLIAEKSSFVMIVISL